MAPLVLAATALAQAPPEPPPAVPPATIPLDQWNLVFDTQDVKGKEYTFTGHPAEVEDSRMLFRADNIVFNEETGEVRASGHVYFHHFLRNERIWCERLEYNTDEEKGKFYQLRGETPPRILSNTGILTTSAPFHFEGQWAERIGQKYILYNGWITNCQMPKPWWRILSPKWDIIPGDRVIAHRSQFRLRKLPLLYTPYFYHSLEREPRKSGFLMPSPGHSSRGGFMLGVGYYWAINRSHDVTYRLVDYFSRAYAHNIDMRGKPREGTDYDVILYGVQDRGKVDKNGRPDENGRLPILKYSGLSLYGVFHSELGKGWSARANINYITSFRFRGEWTQSYNEAVNSEIHSVGYIEKNWSTFTLDGVFARLENFQRQEILVTDPETGKQEYVADAVTIHKLPQVELNSRPRQLVRKLPLWLSFESSAGLLSREEPFFNAQNAIVDRFQTGGRMSRVNLSPHVTSAIHLGYIHLVPSVGFYETFYAQAQESYLDHYRVIDTDIVRSARDFSLDLILPSLARVYQKKTIFGDKLKHVIEPRATYRYVTGVGTDFNRFIRFDGTDLLSNTNEVTVSLTNRIYAKRGNFVREMFTWDVMQKRYFDPTFGGALLPNQRNVFTSTSDLAAYAFLTIPRTTSPVISILRVSPLPGLGIQWQADYDPLTSSIVNSSFALDYRWARYFASVGKATVRTNPSLAPEADQYRFRGGFGDPNHRGWNAGFSGIYDGRKGVMPYSITQVTYNTDCCGISVQLVRYSYATQNDTQFRIAFAIANVGTFGMMRKQDRLF